MNKHSYCILKHLYEKHKEGFIGDYCINEFAKTVNFSQGDFSVALLNLINSKYIILCGDYRFEPIIPWGSTPFGKKLDYDNCNIYIKIEEKGIKYFEEINDFWKKDNYNNLKWLITFLVSMIAISLTVIINKQSIKDILGF